jgi:uncharacterized protein with HEPN domain
MIDSLAVNQLISTLKGDLHNDLTRYNEMIKSWTKESDWTFIIKCHAMVEAIITELLVAHLGDERLHSVVEQLPLGDPKTGKLVMAKKLGLVSDDEVRFFRKLSELRNKLAHRLDSVDFTFEAYFATMNSDQRKNWLDAMSFHSLKTPEEQDWKDIAIKRPKISIHFGFMQSLYIYVLKIHKYKGCRAIEDIDPK